MHDDSAEEPAQAGRAALHGRAALATLPILAAAASNDVAGVRWALERSWMPNAQGDW